MTQGAFTLNYGGVVRELKTDAAVKPPNALVGDDESLKIEVNAIWDTGATGTVITEKIVSLLELKPTGKTIVYGVNSQDIVNKYIVDIEFPNKIIFPNFEVMASNLNSPA